MRQACRGLDNQNVRILKELQEKIQNDCDTSSTSGEPKRSRMTDSCTKGTPPTLEKETEDLVLPDDSISQVLVQCPPVSKVPKNQGDTPAKGSKKEPKGHDLPGGQRIHM
eukprot:2658025-Lingulodinium_polyedra.AAC.1